MSMVAALLNEMPTRPEMPKWQQCKINSLPWHLCYFTAKLALLLANLDRYLASGYPHQRTLGKEVELWAMKPAVRELLPLSACGIKGFLPLERAIITSKGFQGQIWSQS